MGIHIKSIINNIKNQPNIMYSITQETKNLISTNLYEASIVIASIPEELIDEEMKKIIEIILHNTKNNINLLDNLIATQELDSREFHQMD